MRPVLVALDFKQARARRYWPKPHGGFVTDDAALEGTNWGSDDGLRALEDFRETAGRERKTNVPMTGAGT